MAVNKRRSVGRATSRSHEKRALRLLGQLTQVRSELSAAEGAAFESLIGELNQLRGQRRESGIEALDRSIMEEVVNLLQKYRRAKQSQNPPLPDEMWAILEEMLRLLMKLVTKAWYLQDMQPPEYPRPPKPGPVV